jgi:ABC-2 type transport system ATP-binding protein
VLLEAPEKAIEVKGLTKCYGSLRAVDDVSFTVGRGEVVGLLGPNGAGKSTTMRILCGLADATSGSAWVCHAPVSREPAEVKRRIGYMAEHNPLPEDMRVLEYLRFRARLKEVPRRRLKERVDTAMEICDLNRKARRRIIGTLSKGFRQRVGIADAIMGEPEIVIMDEPTIGLDPHQVLGIRQLLDNLRGRMTVVLSSHILPEIEMACDRVIIINRGRIVASGTSTQLREQFIEDCNFRVVVRAGPREVEEELKRVDPEIGLCAEGRADAEGFHTIILSAPNNPSLGERIISQLTRRGHWTLREVTHLQPNLEDIFLAATRRGWEEVSGTNGGSSHPRPRLTRPPFPGQPTPGRTPAGSIHTPAANAEASKAEAERPEPAKRGAD